MVEPGLITRPSYPRACTLNLWSLLPSEGTWQSKQILGRDRIKRMNSFLYMMGFGCMWDTQSEEAAEYMALELRRELPQGKEID